MPAPYTRRFPGGFVDKPATTTPTEAAFYNNMEDALLALLGDTPVADEVGVWVGGASGGLVYQKIKNAQIDAAAAIDKTKLGPLNIVDADVASAANISKSKLGPLNISQADVVAGNKITAQALSAGPPANPTTGDIWIATAAGANGEVWMFRYNGASASAHKWEFIGGSPLLNVDITGTDRRNTVLNTWQQVPGSSTFTIVRAGEYDFRFGSNGAYSNSTLVYLSVHSSASSAWEPSVVQSRAGATTYGPMAGRVSTRANGGSVAAGVTIYLNMHTSGALTDVSLSKAWMEMIPVRIS